MEAGVEVHAEEVEGGGERGASSREARERREERAPAPLAEGVEEGSVVEPPGGRGEEPVEGVPRPRGREAHHVVRDADRRAGRGLPDRRGGGLVRGEEVVEGPGRVPAGGEARRHLAVEVAAENEDERLVQDRPAAGRRAESARDPGGEAAERVDGRGRGPRRPLVEPARVGVVEERDDRLEAEGGEPRDEPRVALERRLVERPVARLDAAPGDGEAERVRPERDRRRRVVLVAFPGAGRPAACAAAGPSGGLPVGPVTRVVPLDLVVGDGDAEEARPVGEGEGGGHGGA